MDLPETEAASTAASSVVRRSLQAEQAQEVGTHHADFSAYADGRNRAVAARPVCSVPPHPSACAQSGYTGTVALARSRSTTSGSILVTLIILPVL